ncbi:MAG: FAD-binding protein [Deltaproteobacteria bacterium]|nr:FAD-binding protein [Deltaproteobacteria bacterium]
MPRAEEYVDRVVETDLLVVGSEGAGAQVAIEAANRGVRPLVITKGAIGRTGASQCAGADFNVDGISAKELGFSGDDRDSQERFFSDIIHEGLFLNNQKMVEKYVEYAPKSTKNLLDWGMRVYYYASVHSEEIARGLTSSGKRWVNALRKKFKSMKLPIIEDTMVVDLLVSSGRIAGAVALDFRSGEIILIKAKAVVLATGGFQMAYPFNSATYDLTGDGQAMAARIGVPLIGMEMVQFIPTTILWPPMERGSIITYIFTELDTRVRLLNSLGQRFMSRYDPKMLEKSTKEIVSIASELEVMAGRGTPHGGVYFSMKYLGEEELERMKNGIIGLTKSLGETRYEFKTLLPRLIEFMKKEDIEVSNACHFMVGGIKVNELTETEIPGLYAAGECSGGLWGANRVAAACTQVGVQGLIAGKISPEFIKRVDQEEITPGDVKKIVERIEGPFKREKGMKVEELRRYIHDISGKRLGVIRDGKGIKEAIDMLKEAVEEVPKLYVSDKRSRKLNREWIGCLEMENMLTCLYATAIASSVRKEGRGAFYRSDFVLTNHDNFLKNTIVRVKQGKFEVGFEPIVTTTLPLPKGKMTFEEAVGVATASLVREDANKGV